MTGDLRKDIGILKSDLDKVLFNLENIDENTFESRIGLVHETVARIKEKREKLLSNYPKEELQKFNPELEIYIKQITENFDSIISEKQAEQTKISEELKKVNNKKKLANYSR